MCSWQLILCSAQAPACSALQSPAGDVTVLSSQQYVFRFPHCPVFSFALSAHACRSPSSQAKSLSHPRSPRAHFPSEGATSPLCPPRPQHLRGTKQQTHSFSMKSRSVLRHHVTSSTCVHCPNRPAHVAVSTASGCNVASSCLAACSGMPDATLIRSMTGACLCSTLDSPQRAALPTSVNDS